MLHPIAKEPDVQASIQAVIADGSWCDCQGWASDRLAAELSSFFSQDYVQLCSSGTIATEIALRGMQVGKGDEVLLAAYDFPGNFRAIEAVEATPVLIDTISNAWVIEPLSIINALSPNTKAIIVSHLHGHNAAMQQIMEIARQHGLHVIEDACQAPGATIDGKKAGAFGDCSTMSFGGSKLLTSGRGGAVMCRDPRIAQRIKSYCERGNDAFALSQLQSAALIPQLKSLPERHLFRSDVMHKLDTKFRDKYEWLIVPHRNDHKQSAFYKWAVFVRSHFNASHPNFRDLVIDRLESDGLVAGRGFHGFHRRSEQRCRKPNSLDNSLYATEATVLLGHQCFHQTGLIERLTDLFDYCDTIWHANTTDQ